MKEVCGITLGQNGNSREVVEAYYDFLCGSEPLNQVPYYLLLMRKAELLDKQHTYKSRAELAADWLNLPETTIVQYQLMPRRPKKWCDSWGIFPEDTGGLLIVWITIPGSNANIGDASTYKKVMLAFSNTPNSVLNLRPPLRNLFWYKCVSKNPSRDCCNRAAGSGVHVLTGNLAENCEFISQ